MESLNQTETYLRENKESKLSIRRQFERWVARLPKVESIGAPHRRPTCR